MSGKQTTGDVSRFFSVLQKCGRLLRHAAYPHAMSQSAVADVAGARCVIDYALARRAVLTGLAAGRIRPEDACDAAIYLRRAAQFHGERTVTP